MWRSRHPAVWLYLPMGNAFSTAETSSRITRSCWSKTSTEPRSQLKSNIFWPEPRQLNSTPAQRNSQRERSERAASRCQRHLPLKMHLGVSFYYLVITMCRFKVRCLLSPLSFDLFSPACDIGAQFLAACTGQLRAGSYKFWPGIGDNCYGTFAIVFRHVRKPWIDHPSRRYASAGNRSSNSLSRIVIASSSSPRKPARSGSIR